MKSSTAWYYNAKININLCLRWNYIWVQSTSCSTNIMGNLRNLELTETVLNSIHLLLREKANLFFTTMQLRYIPFFSLRRLELEKLMRFHFVQVERDSVGQSPPWLQTSFSSLSLWKFWMRRWRMDTGHEDGRQPGKTCVAPGGGSYFLYILSKEIETMFSQLVSWLCALRQTKDQWFLRQEQKHSGRRRDCYSLLHSGNSQMSLFRHTVWFALSFK